MLAASSFSSPSALLEQVRQQLQGSLAVSIVPQPVGTAGAQLWQIGPVVRLLATPPAPAGPPPAPAGCPTLLVYEYVSSALGAQLRAQGTYYADAVGNAWLHHPALLVSVQGRPAPVAASPVALSPVLHVQVLRLLVQLVQTPALAACEVPALAAHTQLPEAVVRQVLRQLPALGCWQEDNVLNDSRLIVPAAARYWLAHYAPVLRRRLNAQRYRPRRAAPLGSWLRQPLPTECRWSGEAAAHLLLDCAEPPTGLTIYSSLPRAQLVQQLDLVPHAQGPVELLNAFMPSACVAPTDPRCVPPLVAYADLLASQKPLGEPLAHALRTRYLAPLLGSE